MGNITRNKRQTQAHTKYTTTSISSLNNYQHFYFWTTIETRQLPISIYGSVTINSFQCKLISVCVAIHCIRSVFFQQISNSSYGKTNGDGGIGEHLPSTVNRLATESTQIQPHPTLFLCRQVISVDSSKNSWPRFHR